MNMDNHKVIVTFKEPWDRTSAPVKRKDWQHTDITMVFDHVNLVDIDVTGWLVVRFVEPGDGMEYTYLIPPTSISYVEGTRPAPIPGEADYDTKEPL
jgi:hypothetical protein